MVSYEVLDTTWRMALCYALMFCLFVLSVITFSVPLESKIEIPFLVMLVYYWGTYRPTLIPPVLIFALGLSFDLLSGMPVGLTSFFLLFMRFIILDQRLFLMGQPFSVMWLGYALASLIVLLLQWLVFGLLQFSWTALLPVAFSFIAGVICFPIVAVVLNLSHKLLPVVPDQYSAVK